MGRERKEEEGIFFFTCCFSHFTLNCFLFISSPLLTSILSSCLSFLRSPLSLISYVSQYFNLALMLFFHPLLLIDVLLGRKYMGFSHSSTGPIPTPTTHTHSFSVFPPDSLCLMSEGKVLKKTTHIPPQSILGVCWNFMPLVVPSTLTVRFYGNTIIRGRLWDENISASGLKRHLCLMI